MHMDMSSPSSVGAPSASSTPPMSSMSPMDSMSGMSSTFSSSTRVTLWFTNWTTTTTTTYVLTVIFLFSLGLLNRFLGALKSQLERKWSAQHPNLRNEHTEKSSEHTARGHVRQWSRALRPQPVRLEEPEGQETEPLSPAPQPHQAEKGGASGLLARSRNFWVANAPWSIKRDGISAALESVRALVGYILYVHPQHARELCFKTDKQTECSRS